MDDKQLDALKFAVNEKANQASTLMTTYAGNDKDKVNFYRGQYQAYNEIYSILSNI